MPSPRIGLVLWFWQCDKENHGWREGPPLTDPCRLRSVKGLHPPGKFNSNEKRILTSTADPQTAHSVDWPVYSRFTTTIAASVSAGLKEQHFRR
jgi:hypothetical protein